MNKQRFAPIKSDRGGLHLGLRAVIRAQSLEIGKGVVIGDDVEILCDSLRLGDGVRIQAGTRIIAPIVEIAHGSCVGKSVEIAFNRHFKLGPHSFVGNESRLGGQGMTTDEFFWMDERVHVGGGGSKGPNAYLVVGSRTSIFEGCYINLSESVSIGSNTALSAQVTLLTHGVWQPVLMGYSAHYAPIRIGDGTVVFVKATVVAGTTIGDFCTVGANSLVTCNMPDHSQAVGVPARVMKLPKDHSPRLSTQEMEALVLGILKDYLLTLPDKGVEVEYDRLSTEGLAALRLSSQTLILAFFKFAPDSAGSSASVDISLALGKLPPGIKSGCHFDLDALEVSGQTSPLAEDLRDYLRRRSIRIFSDRMFSSLPLKEIDRLLRTREEGAT